MTSLDKYQELQNRRIFIEKKIKRLEQRLKNRTPGYKFIPDTANRNLAVTHNVINYKLQGNSLTLPLSEGQDTGSTGLDFIFNLLKSTIDGQGNLERELKLLRQNIENVSSGETLRHNPSTTSICKSQSKMPQLMLSPSRVFGNTLDLNTNESVVSSPSAKYSGIRQRLGSPVADKNQRNMPRLTQREECSRSCSNGSVVQHESCFEDQRLSESPERQSQQSQPRYNTQASRNNEDNQEQQLQQNAEQQADYDQDLLGSGFNNDIEVDTESFFLAGKSERNDYVTSENSIMLEQGSKNKYFLRSEQHIRAGKSLKQPRINSFSTNIFEVSKNYNNNRSSRKADQKQAQQSPSKYIKSYLKRLKKQREAPKVESFGVKVVSEGMKAKIMESNNKIIFDAITNSFWILEIEHRLVATHSQVKQVFYKSSRQEQQQLMNTHDLQIKLREGLVKRILELNK